MSKIIVSANSQEHLINLLNKNIDGVIISIAKLSVNDSFYLAVEDIKKIDFKGKEVFVSINKLMHNSDIDYLRKVMLELKTLPFKILFYDMAVYNIAKEYNMVDSLVIYQDHLNASSLSNKFYHNLGIGGSYITQDITGDELLEIKKHSGMNIMFMIYGYSPIFYSRRYLITNYLKYLGKKKKNAAYSIVSDTGVTYPIEEETYGTTVYTEKIISLINYLDKLKDIDYLVMRSNKISDKEFNLAVDKVINHESDPDSYIGFFNTKTIYKVK